MTGITVETPKALLHHALDGRLSKHALASLLAPESRPVFLEACARIERRYTEACTAACDPCLESGCSCQGEACLEPVLRASTEYLKACGAEWALLFADANHRDRAWTVTAAEYEIAA